MSQHNKNGVGGRNASEGFVKESRFGPGNPFRLRVAALHQEMLKAVDGDSMQERRLRFRL